MNYISQLSIKSFRKFELNLLLNFFMKVKKVFFTNVYTTFLIVKFRLLFKTLLNLFSNLYLKKIYDKNVYNIILSNNYYYMHDQNLNQYNNFIYYNSYILKNIFKDNNKLLYDSLSLRSIYKVLFAYKLNSFSSMPVKKKSFTVLRSPHTDKKSREQFILKKYKKLFNDKFNLFNLLNSFTFLFSMKTCQLTYKKYTKL